MQRIGTEWKTDYPKLGPSMLIAASLIVAIRTAKWAAKDAIDPRLANVDHALDREITYAAHIVHRVMTELTRRHADIFPGQQVPIYDGVNDEDERP